MIGEVVEFLRDLEVVGYFDDVLRLPGAGDGDFFHGVPFGLVGPVARPPGAG
jgi:hypothetical protein